MSAFSSLPSVIVNALVTVSPSAGFGSTVSTGGATSPRSVGVGAATVNEELILSPAIERASTS
jgi:hypothetical protein